MKTLQQQSLSSLRSIPRRRLLQALGTSAAVLPFLPLLNASGQEATYPKRLVIVYTPHGTIYDAWKPSGSVTDFELGPILAPLSAYQQKLIVLDGLQVTRSNVTAPPHTEGFSLLWTGSHLRSGNQFNYQGDLFDWVDGPSVDQVIAQGIGAETPFPSIELGVIPGSGNGPNTRMIYAAGGQPLQPERDPRAAFTRLFANATPGAVEDPAALAERARRQSVIDAVKADLTRLESKVASEDRLKIEAHLAGVRDLERRLTATPTRECTPPTISGSNLNDMPNVWSQQWDILAGAFSCDLTRVASLQLRFGDNDNSPYPWLGVNGGHHDISHEPDSNGQARADLIKIYTWYAEKIAEFLGKLASIPEGDGTLLDHTLVVWGSEVGKGNNHSFSRVPFVLAGGLGGALPMGRYLQYSGGVRHNRLLVSLCQLMGLGTVTSFGSTDGSTGGLDGLT